MLEDIQTLDAKDVSTFVFKSSNVDPGATFTKEQMSELKKAWSERKDAALTPSLEKLADHVREMYFLLKAHPDKSEISEQITRYRRLMLGLSKLGVIELEYYEGKV